jgi:hypothetical protein
MLLIFHQVPEQMMTFFNLILFRIECGLFYKASDIAHFYKQSTS